MTDLTVGIIRINNGCALQDNVDTVGHHLVRLIDQGIFGYARVEKVCSVPENSDLLKEKLKLWVDEYGINVILTLSKVTENSSENITITVTNSLLNTEIRLMKILSQLPAFASNCFFAGIRGKTLIITLPDNVTVARRGLKLIAPDFLMLTSLLLENDNPDPLTITTDKFTQNNVIQLSVTEAEKKLISFMLALRKTITVSLPKALGHVLARDVKYDSEVPPFDISSVSGFAVASEDHSEERAIIGFCAARQPAINVLVKPGVCVRVEKHSGIPPGADAVIDEQFVNIVNGSTIIIEGGTVRKNLNIILQDSLRGILVKGTYLNKAFIDHLKINNVSSVDVYKKPDVAIFSTCRTQRQHWLIHTLKRNGFHVVWNVGIPSDAREWFRELQEAFTIADVAVTIGVSTDHSLLQVLNYHFLSVVYTSGEGQHRVFFANIFVRGEQKIWFGFSRNFTEYSVEKFLLTPLFYSAHLQYTQRQKAFEIIRINCA